MKKRMLITLLVAAIVMTGCTVQQRTISENLRSSENNGSIPPTSSSAESAHEKENTEKTSVEIPIYTATLDQYGNLEIDYSSSAYANLNWVQLDGYSLTG